MKKRLDVLLVELGFYESREKAKRNIMAGNVYVDDQVELKSGTNIDLNSKIRVKEDDLKYVSRGGLKLEKAINFFKLDLKDKICLDIGASTGGFTDCMLQNNCKKVYSVDVGYNQLDYKLRSNKKVIVLEKTHFVKIENDKIEDLIDFVSIDVSFISLKPILSKLVEFKNENMEVVALIKPQFESTKEEAAKHKGIIKDKSVHKRVVKEVVNFARENGFYIKNLTFSPIKGKKGGNIEYLAYFKCEETDFNYENIDNFIDIIIEESNKNF